MRFHVDLQRASRVTGHDELDHAVGAATLARAVARQPQEPRLAVAEGPQCLTDDDRLGATAADPALDGAVGMDDPARAGPSRRRPADGDDRGDGERPPGRLELGCPREVEAVIRRPPCLPQFTPFSCRIAQTFWGVMGMSMLRTPRCHSASTTAFAMAGGAPTVADSPTPLAPIG